MHLFDPQILPTQDWSRTCVVQQHLKWTVPDVSTTRACSRDRNSPLPVRGGSKVFKRFGRSGEYKVCSSQEKISG